MMKRLVTLLCGAAMTLAAMAVPANPMPVVMTQPDGTKVTARLCGDEFYSFSTTLDNYTIVQNTSGAWVYAIKDGDNLVASSVLAHDAGQRSAEEIALLDSTPKRLTNRAAVASSKRARIVAQGPAFASGFDLSQFRGLIILIKPKDTPFSMGDNTPQFYDEIVNTPNFTKVSFGSYGNWTGSVRDYFYDNSMGQFEPQFDIYGPVEVSYNAQEFKSEGRKAFREALSKLNSTINYALYDGNNDGYVDNVCFVVAGYGSHVQGNPSGLLWPHESTGIGQGTYDGKRIDKYSCSTEMGGSYGWAQVDGIGTFCHEFTHVLGLPDFYDADYEENGQSHDPGEWDIMAGGSYLNNSRTPAGYSIFQRYALGFASPVRISGEGSYTLNPLAESNEGYILRTPVNKEYFMFENRQKTSKWDRYLPGHGMIVARVDSTIPVRWVTNKVNNYASHNCYELLRAGNSTYGAQASDPFPGTNGTPNITNTSIPSLQTWNGTNNNYSIMSITETNGIISFNVVVAGEEQAVIETFDKIAPSTESPYIAEGDIATWRLAQCQTDTIEGTNLAVAMKNPSVIQMMTPIYYNIYQVAFNVTNTSTETAKLGLLYSTDNGSKWTAAKTTSGSATHSVGRLANLISYWNVELDNTQPAMFRITMTGGSKTAPCNIDNFTVYYSGEPGGPGPQEGILGDFDNNGIIDVEDVNAAINIILKLKSVSDYPGNGDMDGNGIIDVEDVNAIINIILKL
ncbi:MAG: M6 family metalloprotease domain-containing protein [Muribaculaceae bacterium]|nr:M6 family metalloprotease domain-containing protein [Muribaculaceae bacterium]